MPQQSGYRSGRRRDNEEVSLLLVRLLARVMALLVRGVLWWASSLDTDKAHRKDYGLLREVAKVPSRTAATSGARSACTSVGVRATTVPDPEGNGLRILVFPADRADRRCATLLADEPLLTAGLSGPLELPPGFDGA